MRRSTFDVKELQKHARNKRAGHHIWQYSSVARVYLMSFWSEVSHVGSGGNERKASSITVTEGN